MNERLNTSEIRDRWSRLGRSKRVVGGGVAVLLLFVLPYILSASNVYLLTWMLIFGILATGYNIQYGYTGMLSFGHAAFFGGGAYTTALLLQYTEIRSFILLLGAGVLATGILAGIIGALSLRSTDIYYALLTLAFAQILYALSVRFYSITGGTDGLQVAVPTVFGVSFQELSRTTFVHGYFYFLVLLIFLASISLIWLMMNSPLGLTFKLIRDNSSRARAIGIPTLRYRWYSQILGGVFPGIAGVLYAILFGHVTPDALYWTMSGDILFMTLLGGTTSFFGPLLGASLFIALSEYAVGTISEYWQLTMGVILFVIVLTVKERGVLGGLNDAVRYLRRWRS